MKKLENILTKPAFRPMIRRVIFCCTPPALLLIAAISCIGYFTIYSYMNTAIERNVRIRSTVIARSIEDFLDNRIRDISYLRQGRIDRQNLLEFMQRQVRLDPGLYREIAFISTSPETSIVLMAAEGEVRQIAAEDYSDVQPNPMLLPATLHALEPEEVACTPIVSTDFPFPAPNGIGNRQRSRIFRLITPVTESGKRAGYLMLGVDALRLRNVLSQVSTSKGKAWGYERSSEVRFSYLFDTEGWMLFQSEDIENTDENLSTHMARSGFVGTLGKPELLSAFLPDKAYQSYWETVNSIRKGQGGLIRLTNDQGGHQSSTVSSSFMAFEPIHYKGKAGGEPQLFSGLVYIDRSKLAFDAGKAAIIMSLTWLCGGILLLGLFVQVTRNFFIRPLNGLIHQIRNRLQLGDCAPIITPDKSVEVNELAAMANELLRTLDVCEGRLADISEHPMSITMKQPLDLTADYQAALAFDKTFPDIIGTSAGMIELKAQILKAAGTHVDIFIVGQTGTGKQLVAEAIHNYSSRRNGPFVAINCGALNEHLLLDALFGHVKGAHSEAKTDRNGAFVEATGGTLFLDEIQTASSKVQQALLRAIAARKVQPLGSDTEIAVDIRLITATNEDLTHLIKDGQFREDLYYRLYVLTIKTLPLRNHREDIPLLAHHYLKQTQEFVEKTDLQFSKGAIKRLLSYDWPGNVRELVNCITRTVVFAEGPVIQADDLRMEDAETYSRGQEVPSLTKMNSPGEGGISIETEERQGKVPGDETDKPRATPQSSVQETVSSPLALSPRQIKALAFLLEQKTTTRKEYQQIIDARLPARTANYDLNDMVGKGILVRIGAGSNTRYNLSPSADLLALRRMLER